MSIDHDVPEIDGFADLQVVNEGGAGIVYSAHDTRHGRDVAIKVLVGQSLDNTIRESFARELNAMGRLSDHPNIVSVYQSGFTTNTNRPYFAMPLFENGSYADKLKVDGPLDSDELIDLAIKILSALETAHQRDTLHRDIKPANIFVGRYQNQPILGDFGIATLLGSGRTTTKATAYTLAYAAPEILDGQRQTKQSDIYSLGATLHTFLTGTPPYDAETTSALLTQILTGTPNPLPPQTSPQLADLLTRMIARNPAERPQTCLEIAQHLQDTQLTHQTPITVEPYRHDDTNSQRINPPTSPAEQPTQPAAFVTPSLATKLVTTTPTKSQSNFSSEPRDRGTSRSSKALIAIAAVATVLALAGGVFLVRQPEPNNQAEQTDEPTEPTVLHTLTTHQGAVFDATFSPDGATFATASDDGSARIWDTATGTELHTLQHDSSIFDIGYSPDGEMLATASDDGTAMIWDTATGTQLHTLQHTGTVRDITFSPDGTTIATASFDNTATIWDTTTGTELHTLQHVDAVRNINFSPDGTTLATASTDETAKLWDTTTGTELHTFQHTGAVWNVSFNPDGTTLATASDDGTAIIWDTTTGVERHTLQHTNTIWHVDFTPDGTTLVTGSEDETAKIWGIPKR